jgi:hypothetical protein
MYVHKLTAIVVTITRAIVNAFYEPVVTNRNLLFWTVRGNNSFIYTFSLGTIILKLIHLDIKAVSYYSATDPWGFHSFYQKKNYFSFSQCLCTLSGSRKAQKTVSRKI